jgi:uracil phosphoribosyltransferase
MSEGEVLDIVKEEFPIDTSSMKRTNFEGLGPDTTVYKVEGSSLIPKGYYTGEKYIIDTLAGGLVACHPHIVGEELKTLCLEAARDFVMAAEQVCTLSLEETALLNILRAGACYMVEEAIPIHIPVINIRTEYVEDGYRAHNDDPRGLKVSYRSIPEALEGVDTLLIPDTYATGRSAEMALLDVLIRGLEPERVIIYGFIAISALVRLGALCNRHDVSLTSFAVCDITQLANNNYDMAIYGLDESYYHVTGEPRKLGSIIASETLIRLFPSYVPGLDQPGDWSERQTRLFNGVTIEDGNIKGHLEKSITLIERLEAMAADQPWYCETQDMAARRELEALKAELARRL